MKSSWYAVTLSKTSVVPFADLIDALNGVQSSTEELSMIVNLILKARALPLLAIRKFVFG